MSTSERSHGVLIVGAGLSAVRIAEQLRRGDYAGPITIVGEEDRLPYDRPPLSKEVLRGEAEDSTLKPAQFYADRDITLRLGARASAVDVGARLVTLDDGSSLAYDDLVIATGLVPRRIPSFPDLTGIHVLRTHDHSIALREAATGARAAVVVGAGFIGCEVAASLRARGVAVTLVEPQPTPLASVLGEQVGELIARMHRDEGVELRCGVEIVGVDGGREVSSVTLDDGTEIGCELVVVGIGSDPAVRWLADSGIELDNGVLCDAVGRTSAAHVWALGDVASWRSAAGAQVRVEHWGNVADQSRALAPALLGADPPSAVPVPYFWSDQYDVKIQALGTPRPADTVHLVEDDGRKFLALYERDGTVAAVVGAGLPGKVTKVRAKIAAGAPIGDVLG